MRYNTLSYVFTTLFLLALIPDLKAQVYVDTNATGANNGTSWIDAYNDLQDAIADAAGTPGADNIYVAEGTYVPSTTTDRTISFEIPGNTTIYGGFSPSNGAIDLGTRDFASYPTILSGDLGVPGDINDNTNTVVLITSNTAPILLDGFTIRDGNENCFCGFDAAGIFIHNLAGGVNLTVNNSFISNNNSLGAHAAIGANGPNHILTVNNSFITNNTSSSGSVVYAGTMNLVNISNTTIANNVISDDFNAA
jgi:hypothetical protein